MFVFCWIGYSSQIQEITGTVVDNQKQSLGGFVATTTVANQQVFGSKIVTDLSLGYKASEALTLTVGANNLLDVYPDRAKPEFGNRSGGRFDWSRRATQFGFAGRFLFARVAFTLK